MRNAYKILTVKPEGKRLLGRPDVIWENSIDINLEKNYVDRI
jgi:hypothetical protein